MDIRKGDRVKIISGKDKGKEGPVLKVLPNAKKIVVEGVGIVTKHVKPGAVSKEGGIIKVESPVNIANALPICQKCNLPARVGFEFKDGRKIRICKRCGGELSK